MRHHTETLGYTGQMHAERAVEILIKGRFPCVILGGMVHRIPELEQIVFVGPVEL